MPWVRFTGAFDFRPTPVVTLAFPAGAVRLVTTPCARAAKASGAAVAATREEIADARSWEPQGAPRLPAPERR